MTSDDMRVAADLIVMLYDRTDCPIQNRDDCTNSHAIRWLCRNRQYLSDQDRHDYVDAYERDEAELAAQR